MLHRRQPPLAFDLGRFGRIRAATGIGPAAARAALERAAEAEKSIHETADPHAVVADAHADAAVLARLDSELARVAGELRSVADALTEPSVEGHGRALDFACEVRSLADRFREAAPDAQLLDQIPEVADLARGTAAAFDVDLGVLRDRQHKHVEALRRLTGAAAAAAPDAETAGHILADFEGPAHWKVGPDENALQAAKREMARDFDKKEAAIQARKAGEAKELTGEIAGIWEGKSA